MKIFMLVLAVSMATGVHAGQRVSSDGVPLPDVLNPAPFKATLPIIRDKLGGTPEEFGGRIFNSEKSKSLLDAKTKYPLKTEWFTIGFAGADVVGFDLADGRVVNVVCVFSKARPDMKGEVAKAMSRLGKVDDHQICAVKGSIGTKGLPVQFDANQNILMFAADKAGWYAITHDVSDEIARAMVERRPLVGMSLEQMNAMFGEPSGKEQSADAAAYTWTEYRLIYPEMSTRSMTAEEEWEERGRIIRTPPTKQVSRIVRASFLNGVLHAVSDKVYPAH